MLFFFQWHISLHFLFKGSHSHFSQTLKIGRREQLFTKRSCVLVFSTEDMIDGHIITGGGVPTDLSKIEIIVSRSKPKNLKALEELLGF